MDRCTRCHDWLMPDESGPLCWQCDTAKPEVPVLDMNLPMNAWERLLILFVAMLAYLMISSIR